MAREDHYSEHPPPPSAPPLPPTTKQLEEPAGQSRLRLRTEVSSVIRNRQAALTTGHSFQSDVKFFSNQHPHPPGSPLGWYFVYGTLMDPGLLAEILSLDKNKKPTLRPAKILGYSLKLWGQYPALVEDGNHPGEEVRGMTFRVEEQRHADRLAQYETRAYGLARCLIRFVNEEDAEDGVLDLEEEEEVVEGSTFKYAGDLDQLSDGQFDLNLWLKRMGRLGG